MENELIKTLGKDSYVGVVTEIFENFQNTKPETQLGIEYLNDSYKKLYESITPMLTIKEFISGAKKFEDTDTKLIELVKFCKNKTKTNSLNFIINICKEEHFANLKLINHPSPESTIKEFETYFSSPSSVIEEGIKNGIFNSMKSDLLVALNESYDIISDNSNVEQIDGNIIAYNPIGSSITLKTGENIYLVEGKYFTYTNTNEFKLFENVEMLPVGFKKLGNAIEVLTYEPDKFNFGLNNDWGFDLTYNIQTNEVLINGESGIELPELQILLASTIAKLDNDPINRPQNYNRESYLNEADMLSYIIHNSDNVIMFDELKTLRNLNENSFVVLNNDFDKPEIMLSSKGSMLFENYNDLNNAISNILNKDMSQLFESFLNAEINNTVNLNNTLESLRNEQISLNESINSNKKLLTLADKDSPAYIELNEKANELSNNLKDNIKKMENIINLNESKSFDSIDDLYKFGIEKYKTEC